MAACIRHRLSQSNLRFLKKTISFDNSSYKRSETNDSKLDFCIVGSGPSGMYTVKYLLNYFPNANFDVYDKMSHPFGLLRYGVAPDHLAIKKIVTDTFTEILKMKQCSFIGNVHVGKDVTVEQLRNAYHAVILCTGAEFARKLNIEGEDLKNVLSAKSVFSWYNGHPDYNNLDLNLDGEDAVIIGNGNAALDIARILLSKIDKLRKTNLPEYALATLSRSRVRRVFVVGRRGPQHASFSASDFRTMTESTDFNVYRESVNEVDCSLNSIEDKSVKRNTLRILNLQTKADNDPNSKYLELLFLKSPIAFLGNECVNSVRFKKNGLSGDKTYSLLETVEIPCQLAIYSIGLKSAPFDTSVPFDAEKCILKHENYKIGSKPGLYCNGWAANGASGVIATTAVKAVIVCQTIKEDITFGHIDQNVGKVGKRAIIDILYKKSITQV